MKYFLTIAAVLILIAGLAVGFLGHLGVMSAAVLAFIALLIAANLDRISEFKASAGGVEAKTREIIARAENTLSELQLLAKQTAVLTLSIIKRRGRVGGYRDDEQESIKDSVLAVLKKIGIPEKESPEILKDWHRFNELDYAHAILGGSTVPEGADSTLVDMWSKFRRGGIVRIPTPEDIREFVTEHGLSIDGLDEYLKDYEHYITHRTHRRPEVWRNRENWGRLKKI